MAVKEKTVQDVVVITIKGKMMGGTETDEVHEKVKQLLDQDHKKLVIDLSHVKWMNSKGLGMLMACFTSSQNAGAHLKIAGAVEKVNSLLIMTKLLSIFDSYENADQAIGSYLG